MHQVYELNARTWRSERSGELRRPVTLDDLGYDYLDRLVEDGFSWLYLMGVWRIGPLVRERALMDVQLVDFLRSSFPDFSLDDVSGPPMSVAGYEVDPVLGGDEALARLRDRARECGLSLMLDVFPNHVGLDHPWAVERQDLFILGDEHRLRHQPDAYCRLNGRIFAHGRDPFFAPWPTTLQLDFSNPACQEAVIEEFVRVAGRCDGLRVDEAMLVLEDVFENTWGRRPEPFWTRCLQRLRSAHPGTVFLAEVYWNLEYRLQQEGFDFTYDKILYDRLLTADAESIRAHLRADADYQQHSVRFLENEDEQRAAGRFSDPARHRAALFITGMVPGMLLCHHGQEDGRVLHSPLDCSRRPAESGSDPHRRAYRDLMGLLAEPARHDGSWTLLEPRDEGGRHLIACLWSLPSFHQLLVVVNASPHPVTGTVEAGPLASRDCHFQDRLGAGPSFQVSAEDLHRRGVQVSLPPWGTAAYRVMHQR